jgi:hypothetical protein
MKLEPLDDSLLDELVLRGYNDFVLKSVVDRGDGGYFQERPIEVYEARHVSVDGTDIHIWGLKEHIHRHQSECFVVIPD